MPDSFGYVSLCVLYPCTCCKPIALIGIYLLGSGLKPVWVTRVKFVRVYPGQTQIIKICGSDPDLASTALLEYSDLLAHALKVQSCYLFSYSLTT